MQRSCRFGYHCYFNPIFLFHLKSFRKCHCKTINPTDVTPYINSNIFVPSHLKLFCSLLLYRAQIILFVILQTMVVQLTLIQYFIILLTYIFIQVKFSCFFFISFLVLIMFANFFISFKFGSSQSSNCLCHNDWDEDEGAFGLFGTNIFG